MPKAKLVICQAFVMRVLAQYILPYNLLGVAFSQSDQRKHLQFKNSVAADLRSFRCFRSTVEATQIGKAVK
jgi:hypothetical protein